MNTIEEMAKAYADEKYGDYADAVGHADGMLDYIAGYKAASPLRWVNDDNPKKSGMYITEMEIIDKDGLTYNPVGYNYFDATLKKWPNPRLCAEDATVTKWLDEGNADNLNKNKQ